MEEALPSLEPLYSMCFKEGETKCLRTCLPLITDFFFLRTSEWYLILKGLWKKLVSNGGVQMLVKCDIIPVDSRLEDNLTMEAVLHF